MTPEEREERERQKAEHKAQRDRDIAILKSHVSQLSEHFGSVQIIATRHDPESDGTIIVNWGEGDWYARYGAVKWWILHEESDE